MCCLQARSAQNRPTPLLNLLGQVRIKTRSVEMPALTVRRKKEVL
jgi:hypothetical protein